MAFYKLFVPKQAVGANLVYFDLFVDAACGCKVEVESVIPVVSGAVAVTGTLGVDMLLTRTSAIGTGGTAATAEGTDITAATISAVDSEQPIPGGITARLTPTGGATAGAVLAFRAVATEETPTGAAYTQIVDMARGGHHDHPAVSIKPGSGIRVVQGAVASVGNIGFDITLKVTPK